MESKFENGDIVILKSGGDAMTVERIEQDLQVVCVWSHNHQIKRDRFSPHVLEKCEGSAGWGLT